MRGFRDHWLSFLLIAILGASLGEGSAHQRHTVNADRKTSETASSKPQKIPRLLHYIYLDGYDAFMNHNKGNETFDALRMYFNGCQKQHSHWDSLFWDERMARDLIQKEFSSFLPIWNAYESWAQRSDSLRAMILYHYGGLYLDFDIECYKPSDDSFQQFDLMLQGSGNEGFTNAMMASVPEDPFWLGYLEIMKARAPKPVPPNAEKSSPKYMTGTTALTLAVQQYIPSPRPVAGYIGGVFEYNNTIAKIWPLGEWMQPCYGMDHICVQHLENEVTRALWDMSNVYGRHYFLETSPRKHLEHELQDFYVN